jgi:dGTPase
MATYGGFEHNLQSLRIVDVLEERYPDFNGLNLTFEAREGILKHCSAKNAMAIETSEPVHADGLGGVGQRFLNRSQPSMEAQLCNLADEIAYNAHDIDDGVRSGLINITQLEDVELFNRFLRDTLTRHPHLRDTVQDRRLLYETIRQMLSAQVYDVIHTTRALLDAAAPDSVAAVRRLGPLLRFGDEMRTQSSALKQFLLGNLYRHPQVLGTTEQAKRMVRELFAVYMNAPVEMQPGFAARSSAEQEPAVAGSSRTARVVADYIAGMTDRFAAREHERLTGLRLLA